MTNKPGTGLRAPAITPFLWFNDNAREAMEHYVSIFPESRVVGSSTGPDGAFLTGTFEIGSHRFMVLNGGDRYEINPAVSFHIDCGTQEEIDYYWERLGEGGQEMACGWVQDRFGVCWQVVPRILGELMGQQDQAKALKAMEALWSMVKVDIAALEASQLD